MAKATGLDEMLADVTGGVDDAIDALTGGGVDIDAEVEQSTQAAIDALDLDGIVEVRFEPLPDGEWFDFEILKAVAGKSGNSNLQIEFTLAVVDAADPTLNGITISDQALVDPRTPKAHFKIKKYYRFCGLSVETTDPAGKKSSKILTKDLSAFVGRRIRIQNKWDTEYDPSGRNKAANWAPPTVPNPVWTA